MWFYVSALLVANTFIFIVNFIKVYPIPIIIINLLRDNCYWFKLSDIGIKNKLRIINN